MNVIKNHGRVVIWRDDWLPGSETFIRNQSDALKSWKPDCSGLQAIPSPLAREADRVIFARTLRGSLARKAFKLTRRNSRLSQWLEEPSVRLIHAHFGPDATQIVPASRRAGKPLVVTVHGYDVTNFPGGKSVRAWLYRRRLRSLFKYSSRIIAVSEFIRDRAILLGADPGKTVVHHIGIPIDRSPAIMKKSGIVFVGRFSEKKGILDLLSAVGMLEGGLRQTRIDLVGDGPLRTEAESIARVLGLNTRFHGALSPAAVSAVMAGGLLFCGPSRTARNGDAEGLGMVFLEAGAHAMPTVAYRHGGVSEAISHGETGILVEEGDVAALSRALSRVLTDDLLRIRLGAGARKRVEEDFDICIQTEKLEAMYDSVVATWAASEGPQ